MDCNLSGTSVHGDSPGKNIQEWDACPPPDICVRYTHLNTNISFTHFICFMRNLQMVTAAMKLKGAHWKGRSKTDLICR